MFEKITKLKKLYKNSPTSEFANVETITSIA